MSTVRSAMFVSSGVPLSLLASLSQAAISSIAAKSRIYFFMKNIKSINIMRKGSDFPTIIAIFVPKIYNCLEKYELIGINKSKI
jgi:hypothetical protein